MSLTVSLASLRCSCSQQLHKVDDRSLLQVHNALTRKAKEETVEKLEEAFRGSEIVYGMRFKNLNVSIACTISISCYKHDLVPLTLEGTILA